VKRAGDDGRVDQDGGGPMASARDLLQRFRPAGTPGAAAPAGVPYDRGAALEDELRPVLAMLSPTEERCAAQVREAHAHAEQIRADASVRGAALLAQARLRAEDARTEAAEELQHRNDEEAAAEVERAARTAGEVRARARHRLPELTARVLAATRAAMAASEPDRPGSPGPSPAPVPEPDPGPG
jgi:vacuolar-type H+-ATPase subunit H